MAKKMGLGRGLSAILPDVEDVVESVEAAENRLSQLKSENVRLQSALAQKMTMDEIEEYAVNRLGMVKSSRSQITYVKVTDGDSVVYYGADADKTDQGE